MKQEQCKQRRVVLSFVALEKMLSFAGKSEGGFLFSSPVKPSDLFFSFYKKLLHCFFLMMAFNLTK